MEYRKWIRELFPSPFSITLELVATQCIYEAADIEQTQRWWCFTQCTINM